MKQIVEEAPFPSASQEKRQIGSTRATEVSSPPRGGRKAPRNLSQQLSRPTYVGDFPLDVLQEMFLATEEVGVLEFSVILLGLDQPALLDVDHLSETV